MLHIAITLSLVLEIWQGNIFVCCLSYSITEAWGPHTWGPAPAVPCAIIHSFNILGEGNTSHIFSFIHNWWQSWNKRAPAVSHSVSNVLRDLSLKVSPGPTQASVHTMLPSCSLWSMSVVQSWGYEGPQWWLAVVFSRHVLKGGKTVPPRHVLLELLLQGLQADPVLLIGAELGDVKAGCMRHMDHESIG